MYNVPYGEWWDYRTPVYGDLPVGADCFNATSIADGICKGSTHETFPYNNMYPWYADRKDIIVNAPYRLSITGVDQPGSNLSNPVILPVFNPTAVAGSKLQVHWDMQYVDLARVKALAATGCSISLPSMDGYILENQVTVTMDLQESRRLFGVVATDNTSAQAWWNSNTLAGCAFKGPVESRWEGFMAQQGGTASTIGPYDIYNSFEYFYTPFFTDLTATVASDGTTTLKIHHAAWGTEVLLARWFYWGPASYAAWAEINPDAYHQGWLNWYLAWFEDFHFDTTIGPAAQSLTLNAVMQYHLQAYSNPGPDGHFNTAANPSVDDQAEWLWQPYLTDYVYGGTSSVRHDISELDRYLGLNYTHGNPGSIYYGLPYKYDFVPAAWNLGPLDTVTVRIPTTAVNFISPYSPPTSDTSTLVVFPALMGFVKSTPALPAGSSATDTNGDHILDTVTLVGPINWGAPSLPLWGFPALEFNATAILAGTSSADLIGKAAWPAYHHFDMSKKGANQTLYALVTNTGTTVVSFQAVFTIYDSTGTKVATVTTRLALLAFGETKQVSALWPVALGKYRVDAQVLFSSRLGGPADTLGTKVKSFSFAVVP